MWKNAELWQYIPFIGMAIKPPTEDRGPWFTRLIEAAIIGGVTMFGTVRVLDTDIQWIKTSIQTINSEQNDRIKRLENLYFTPRQ